MDTQTPRMCSEYFRKVEDAVTRIAVAVERLAKHLGA